MEKKDINKMKRKEFELLPSRRWDENIGLFDSLIILPLREIHDSGYRCMDFIAVRDNEPICKLSGCSDCLEFNGIGGYGKNWPQKYGSSPRLIPPAAWVMDCLPGSGLLRLWCADQIEAGMALSSFSIFHTTADHLCRADHIAQEELLKKEGFEEINQEDLKRRLRRNSRTIV